MTDYIIKGLVHESENKITIELGYIRIEIEKEAESGPLAYGDEPNSGVTFWENEYIKGQTEKGGVALEYGGGPLLSHSKTDVDRLFEKFQQNKEIGDNRE